MTDIKTISTALVSVFDKQNLAPLVEKLNELSVKIISTGGTAEFIKNLGCRSDYRRKSDLLSLHPWGKGKDPASENFRRDPVQEGPGR